MNQFPPNKVPKLVSWSPIEDIPQNWKSLRDSTIDPLLEAWNDQRKELEDEPTFREFLAQLRREWAIETGILERLYSLSEGATRVLIERGLDAALLSPGDTDRSPDYVVSMVKDQEQAIEGIYAQVQSGRPLSVSFVKQLHQVITATQETASAEDPQGRAVETPLLRGDWKTQPNRMLFEDGRSLAFAPPEQVAAEMDRLIGMHQAHSGSGVAPEVEAAWLHHRFALIHPFQDGNGRVARCLASFVLIRSGWFPLVVRRADRPAYIESLRAADAGDLRPLVQLFGTLQRSEVRRALALSEEVVHLPRLEDSLAAIDVVFERRGRENEEKRRQALVTADALHVVLSTEVDTVAKRLTEVLQRKNPRFQAKAFGAGRMDEKHDYNVWQVVECAKAHGYFANVALYHAWEKLQIRAAGLWEVLFSIHASGTGGNRGIFACSCSFSRRVTDDQDQSVGKSVESRTKIIDIVPLTSEPFEFTFLEEPVDVQRRFRLWVQSTLTKALDLWRSKL